MTGTRLLGMPRPLGPYAEWSISVIGFVLAVLIVGHAEETVMIARITMVAIGALVAWIAVRDIRTFTIPDSASLTIALLAIAGRWSTGLAAGDPPLQTMFALGLDLAIPGGLLLIFREVHYRRKGFDGLGLGDVKLAAAGGLLIGTIGFSWALFAASVLGLVFVAIHRGLARRSDARTRPSDKLAFGAVLAPAIWFVWVLQQMAVLLPATSG